MIIAHRGASRDAPENTLPAFELAWKQEADGIEGDFHLTKDEHVVCIHDADTSRVSAENLVVEESTLAQLRKLDVGNYRGETFAGTGMPTLNDVLGTVPAGKKIYLEIKSDERIIPNILSELKAGPIAQECITFISFNRDVIQQLKHVEGGYKAMLLMSVKPDQDNVLEPRPGDILKILAEIKADGISTSGDAIGESYISTIKNAGYEYHVWTIDDVDRAVVLQSWGVDSITTNCPGKIRRALHEAQAT